MKQIFMGLVLLAGISQATYAQTIVQMPAGNEYPFNIPPNSTNRYFWIDLDKGNKMQLYVNNIDDLQRFKNMDSIIYGFLKDLKQFEDSLKDDRTIKRIDYNLDDAGKRKMRITRYDPAGQAFLVTDEEVALLKTSQDTINFTGKVDFVANYPMRKKFNDTRYYKISFLLNDISDLSAYMNGTLNSKIASLQNNINKRWDNNPDMSYSPRADASIKANSVRGYNAGGDYLTLRASADLQNYKASFVPSVSVGAAIILGSKNIRRELGLTLENHFSFAKNTAGQNRTYISQFLTFDYERGYIKDNNIKKDNYNLLNFSVGYLIRKSGPLYEKSTFRLGAGALSIFDGKTKIQPLLYVKDFFKTVTPGIRWVQSF